MALTWIEDVDAILKAEDDDSAAVRMAAVVALRKLKHPRIGVFSDKDPRIPLESARAIYDTPIPEAMSRLADYATVLDRETPEILRTTVPFGLRVVNAAFRTGRADLVAAMAGEPKIPSPVRIEALRILGEWENPPGRDRLMGLWRPIPARPKEQAVQAIRLKIGSILRDGPPEVAAEAARLGVAFRIEGLAKTVREWFQDPQGTGRAAALRALAELKDPGLAEDVRKALDDRDADVVREAVRLLPQAKLADGAARIEKIATGTGPVPIRQAAIASLAEIGADEVLTALLDHGVPAPLQLDLFEAAGKRPSLKPRVASMQPSLQEGGDAAAGRRIFFERSDVQCVRCHTIGTEGGQVGPPLTKVSEQKTREYLLDSILAPNKQIAEGWGQTAFQLRNDAVEVGRVEKETDAAVTLILTDGQRKTIAKADIKARKAALSSMPEDIAKQLSKRDLRDLVEFLSTLK
jgi:quinoprotein glucose dehydrogenase